MSALKPAVAGLIGASAFALMVSVSLSSGISIIPENFPDWKSWVLFAAALAAYCTKKAGPVTILAAGAILGMVIY